MLFALLTMYLFEF